MEGDKYIPLHFPYSDRFNLIPIWSTKLLKRVHGSCCKYTLISHSPRPRWSSLCYRVLVGTSLPKQSMAPCKWTQRHFIVYLFESSIFPFFFSRGKEFSWFPQGFLLLFILTHLWPPLSSLNVLPLVKEMFTILRNLSYLLKPNQADPCVWMYLPLGINQYNSSLPLKFRSGVFLWIKVRKSLWCILAYP